MNIFSLAIIYFECAFADNISQNSHCLGKNDLCAESQLFLKTSDILWFINEETGFVFKSKMGSMRYEQTLKTDDAFLSTTSSVGPYARDNLLHPT